MASFKLPRINWRRAIFSTARAFRAVLPRAYAAALIVLICYVTFLAVRYLIASLRESGPPAQITEIPTRLDAQALATERSVWRGMEATPNPRTPLAHYHRLDSWIHPDHYNDCARGGCHAPLPHSKRKEIRAFLNMHATSIHCGVCHMQTDQRPLPLVWYDLASGKTQPPPSILEAYHLLMNTTSAPAAESAARELQRRLVNLLRRATKETGGSASLKTLTDHFAAVRAASPAFGELLDSARTLLPSHFRGEYGAKLALKDHTGRPVLGHPDTESAVRDFLARGQSVSGDERAQLLAAVHPRKREIALHCTDCHTTDRSLVDFSKAGYPPARLESLTSPIVFRMIEHINSGRPFNLPQVVVPDRP
jgi:hypothetical protein